jgi:hypothetical protein
MHRFVKWDGLFLEFWFELINLINLIKSLKVMHDDDKFRANDRFVKYILMIFF